MDRMAHSAAQTAQQVTQAYSQAPWRRQLQLIGWTLLIVILWTIVAAVYLDITTKTTAIGRDIQEMQRQNESLNKEIADLQARLAMITSRQVMEDRAVKLGFQPITTEQSLYIVVPGYGGRRQAVFAPPPAQGVQTVAAANLTATESLLDWLRRQDVDAWLAALDLPEVTLPEPPDMVKDWLGGQ